MENWKSIIGYEGLYEVSDQGRVRSLNWHLTGRVRVMRPCKNSRGYLSTSLCKDGQSKSFSIHRLVAQAFIPNPQNLPEVNHRDEVKTNNSVGNLEWCTAQYNNDYSRSKPVQQIDPKTGDAIATFKSMIEAERQTGIYHGNIGLCCGGKRKSAGGYVWQLGN